MSEAKMFPLGVVLTVTTGRVLTGDIGDVYAILDFMTGDALFTHQLPRAAAECKPVLLEQHPHLADVVVPDYVNDGATAMAWLSTQVELFGAELSVTPLRAGRHIVRDPIAELAEMVGDEPIHVIVAPEAAS